MADPDLRAEDDVGETEAWCDNCAEHRRFVKRAADFSVLESEAPSPDVLRAVAGEEGWVCDMCGAFRRTLVPDEAYPVEFANVGALRDPEDEQNLHAEGVSDDLSLRAAADGQAMLHEPATEGEDLHVSEAIEATMEAAESDDPELRREILEDVARQERGEQDLSLPHGPRKEMPPPERLPRRDPTFEG
jgi:hypothetical protein